MNTTDYNNLRAMLKRHEGVRYEAYKDTKGNWTIGVGHLVTKHDCIEHPWTPIEVEDTLTEDIRLAQTALTRFWMPFERLDPVRQCALVDMCFNLGWGKLRNFHNMLASLSVGPLVDKTEQWKRAHDAALESEWAKEVHGRALEIAGLFLTGKWPTVV